ncbi:MAG: MMPL family transporter [Planctomycetota bacterium]
MVSQAQDDPRPEHGGDPVGRWAGTIARRPAVGAALLVLAAALAVIGWRLEPPPSAWTEGEDWTRAADAHDHFDLDRVAGTLAVFGSVLDPANEAAVRSIESSVEEFDWVEDVATPWDVAGLANRSLAEAADHPLAGPAMVAASGEGLLLPILLSLSPVPPPDWTEVVSASARRAIERTDADGLDVGVTGLGPIVTAQSRAFRSERRRLTVLGVLIAFAIASVAFRDPRAVLLAGGGPLVGVAVSIGVARLVGLGAYGFTGVVLPVLVLSIGFTDSLHVVIAAARERQSGAQAGEAMARAVEELAWPCFLTSLTTSIGFLSLALTGNPVVVQFGLSCALATALTFACVLLVLPLLARTPLGSALVRLRTPDLRTKVGDLLGSTLARPRTWAVAAVALTAGLAALSLQLTPDKRSSTDLADGSPAAETLARIDRELGGVLPLRVQLAWDEGVPRSDVVVAAREVRRALDREPLVTGAFGLEALVDALPPGEFGLDLIASAAPAWSAMLVDLEGRRALTYARMPDAGYAALAPAFDRIRAGLADAERNGVRAALASSQVAHLETTASLARDLGRSLAVAAALVLATLALAFRSLRLGLASVVPNTLPIVASAAGLVLVGGHAELPTLTALTLSLGIAADDTIHVLARWTRERARGANAIDGARAAVQGALPALLLTTITLSSAFGVLLTSSVPTIRTFGLLGAVTIATAFVADVLLLPPLLVATSRSRRRV